MNVKSMKDSSSQTENIPIGIFWDLENISVPKNISTIALINKFRQHFSQFSEEEFLVVCDVNKEKSEIINDLVLMDVTVIHIPSMSKNAADEKLKNLILKFHERCRKPCTIVLVSSDINFFPVLKEIKSSHKSKVVIIHQLNVNQVLLTAAHETIPFYHLIENLPNRNVIKKQTHRVVVKNLPEARKALIKNSLKRLSENTGGKIMSIDKNVAKINFKSTEAAQRAARRITQEKMKGRSLIAVVEEEQDEDDEEQKEDDEEKKKEEEKLRREEEVIGNLISLFEDNITYLPVSSIQRLYKRKFDTFLSYSEIGFQNLGTFCSKYPNLFEITGSKHEKSIHLLKKEETPSKKRKIK